MLAVSIEHSPHAKRRLEILSAVEPTPNWKFAESRQGGNGGYAAAMTTRDEGEGV